MWPGAHRGTAQLWNRPRGPDDSKLQTLTECCNALPTPKLVKVCLAGVSSKKGWLRLPPCFCVKLRCPWSDWLWFAWAFMCDWPRQAWWSRLMVVVRVRMFTSEVKQACSHSVRRRGLSTELRFMECPLPILLVNLSWITVLLPRMTGAFVHNRHASY